VTAKTALGGSGAKEVEKFSDSCPTARRPSSWRSQKNKRCFDGIPFGSAGRIVSHGPRLRSKGLGEFALGVRSSRHGVDKLLLPTGVGEKLRSWRARRFSGESLRFFHQPGDGMSGGRRRLIVRDPPRKNGAADWPNQIVDAVRNATTDGVGAESRGR